MVAFVLKKNQIIYDKLKNHHEKIKNIIQAEEESFFDTIIRGFKEFDDVNRAGVSVKKWGGNCKIFVQSGKHKSYYKDDHRTTSNLITT